MVAQKYANENYVFESETKKFNYSIWCRLIGDWILQDCFLSFIESESAINIWGSSFLDVKL